MKAYIIGGIIICTLFFAAGMRGLALTSLMTSAHWGPQGQSQYHK
jgi:hypothetical protein